MDAPYLHTVVVLLVAAACLCGALCFQLAQNLPARNRRFVIAFVVWASLVAWIHVGFPREHRLFFDEDVYANISGNILRGYGATVTVLATGDRKEVEPYKWPVGFPTLVMPAVAVFGAEDGSEIFNELCGALTLAVLMILAARLAGTYVAGIATGCLYGLHPLVGCWYRSGSSEPLALLLALVSIWAAVEYRLAAENNCWLLVAVLAAAIGIHVRLENVLVALPLSILLGTNRRIVSTWQAVVALLLGIPLVVYYVTHVMRLGQYYGEGLPESTFSIDYLASNSRGNFEFLLQYLPWPFLLVSAIAVARAAIVERPARASWETWGALASWQASGFAVLLCYSVGQYGAPGGSRFVLLPILGLSLVTGVALLKTLIQPPVVAIAVVICVMPFPDRDLVRDRIDSINASPRIEHETIRRWATEMEPRAVVVSRLPYMWENLGVFATSPDAVEVGQVQPETVVHVHRGLFDRDSEPDLGDELVDTVTTGHGPIELYRSSRPVSLESQKD